jgi:hypothetical protein
MQHFTNRYCYWKRNSSILILTVIRISLNNLKKNQLEMILILGKFIQTATQSPKSQKPQMTNCQHKLTVFSVLSSQNPNLSQTSPTPTTSSDSRPMNFTPNKSISTKNDFSYNLTNSLNSNIASISSSIKSNPIFHKTLHNFSKLPAYRMNPYKEKNQFHNIKMPKIPSTQPPNNSQTFTTSFNQL